MDFPKLKIDKNRSVFSSDIIFLKANINYTEIHLQNGKKFILAKTLKRFQEDYEPFGFVRINRSVIVNIEFVTKTDNQFENLKLKNKTQFKVSRRRRENLKKMIVQ